MQEHRDEERNQDRAQPFQLPMGGLLSELLASEGIDAGEIAAVATAGVIRPAAAHTEPPPVPAAPPAPSLPEEPVIALPGLLNDLLNLAGAVDPLPQTPVPPPEPPVPQDLGEEPAGQIPASELAWSAQQEAEPDPPALAIPGLLSLLKDELECEPAGAPSGSPPTGESAAPSLPVDVCEASTPALDELEIEDAPEPEAPVFEQPPVMETSGASPALSEQAPVSSVLIAADAGTKQTSPGIEEPPEAAISLPAPVDPEPDDGNGQQYSPADAAAALAEAAGRLVIEAASRTGDAPQGALANLMDTIAAGTAASLGEQPPATPEDCERYVVFQIGDESYGLPISCVREVEKVGRVTSVPGVPPMIRGLVNLHGEILPLVDPRPLLALPPGESAAGGYMVVVRPGDQEGAVAWQVDGLGGMALVDPARISNAASVQQQRDLAGIATGSAAHRGRRLLLLDSRLAAVETVERASGSAAGRPEVGQTRMEESEI